MLTATEVRNAKPKQRTYKAYDARGLYLEVPPSGAKRWRFRYRLSGKEKRISLGTYPDVSLAEARRKRDGARELLAKGVDPSARRQEEKAAAQAEAASTFEAVARLWHRDVYAKRVAPGTAAKNLRRLELYAFPAFGAKPVSEVTVHDLVALLRPLAAETGPKPKRGGPEVARRLRILMGGVFRYAIASGQAQADPTLLLRDVLTLGAGGHLAAATEPAKVGELLRVVWGYQGSPVVRAALRLAPMLAVRPGELRLMRWVDVDLDAAEWRFETPKTKTPHIVPLARQALEILQVLVPLTGSGHYVFPSGRVADGSRPLSEGAFHGALRRLCISKEEATPHGWRATFRTLAEEELGYPPHVLELQLAHTVRDPLGRAYNRTKHLAMRRELMQRWADYLDVLREGGKVLPLRREG